MKIEVQKKAVRFNDELYIADVREAMRVAFRRGAQKFLVAVLSRNFKIFTGFARGSFRNLEDVAGQFSTPKTGPRIEGRRKGSTGPIKNAPAGNRRYYYYPPGGGRVLRTPEAGRDFSTKGENNILKIARGRTNFYFIFKVDITYYDKSAWGKVTWEAGRKAFSDYVDANLKLPDWRDKKYA